MRKIKLTQNKFAIVDSNLFAFLSKFKWCARWNHCNKSYYAVRGVRSFGKNTTQCMHRLIMNAKKGIQVDHINRDTLDNRRQNLRFATPSQNAANKIIGENNKSGFKGVFWDRYSNSWHAKIKVNYKQIHIGFFKTPEDAAKAYNQVALKHFGKFALLNQKT